MIVSAKGEGETRERGGAGYSRGGRRWGGKEKVVELTSDLEERNP